MSDPNSQVYTNVGNAIFGMIGAAGLFFFVIGLVIFLFVWNFSRGFMILLMAWALGLIITLLLKRVVVKYCRKRHYAGFYCRNPKGANLAVLALECCFIGLGGGVLVRRFTQFILAACFFVGRTDILFLSRDVVLLGFAFDYVPTNFVKDILVHEAHRHPYFERLLAVYMMKLKSDKFSSKAGACWRQLFVVALMPWFMKLRVFSDNRLAESLVDAYNAQGLELTSALVRAEEMDDAGSHEPENPSLVRLAKIPTSERKKKTKRKSKSKRSMSKSASKRFDKESELAIDEVADEQPKGAQEIFEEETELATNEVAYKQFPKDEKKEKRKSKSKRRTSKSASNRSSDEAAAPRRQTRTTKKRASD
jgi:hypothetical protein